MILFLDFDGVLHPYPLGRAGKPLSALPLLWRILDAVPELSVVISSTWREEYAFAELAEWLTAGGGERFGARLIGTTPIMDSPDDYVPGIRQREIEAWLAAHHATDHPYVIVDDMAAYFDLSCENLYLVDAATGLTPADADSIIARCRALKRSTS
ncbi:HAD domain-containing protein [Massilia brevitalea]|uniref:HAD domain-containing protein n=1 Tax=Massilia brevitalea TaxID=442526 RepID=UPI00273A5025|nr:HAD domain-containing protein [Massilia brevitalea]